MEISAFDVAPLKDPYPAAVCDSDCTDANYTHAKDNVGTGRLGNAKFKTFSQISKKPNS